MGSLTSAIHDDINDYLALCKKYKESPYPNDIFPNPYSEHAEQLRDRDEGKVPRKSKTDIRHELAKRITDIYREKRKRAKLNEDGQFVILYPNYEFDEEGEEVTKRTPPSAKSGDLITPDKLRSAKSVKSKISGTDYWQIQNYGEDEKGDIPLVDENQNNFVDTLVVEVECKVKRVYRACTLEEIDVKPETQEGGETWDS